MYKLYARPGAGNVCVEAMLAEVGAPHEVIVIERDAEGRLPESLRTINPMMQVPTLVLPDGSVMTESAAILIHLGDTFPKAGLAPAAGSAERPQYLRWMVFLATTLYMSDLRTFYPHRYTVDPSGAEAVKAQAISDMDNELGIYAAALGGRPYITGERLTAADIYAAMLIGWVPDGAALARKFPALKGYYDRVTARPKIAEVWKRNDMG